jgi:hypothetical protein
MHTVSTRIPSALADLDNGAACRGAAVNLPETGDRSRYARAAPTSAGESVGGLLNPHHLRDLRSAVHVDPQASRSERCPPAIQIETDRARQEA